MARKHSDNPYKQPTNPNGNNKGCTHDPYSTHYHCAVHGYIPHSAAIDSPAGLRCTIMSITDNSVCNVKVRTKRRYRSRGKNPRDHEVLISAVRAVPLTDEEVMALIQ